MSIIQSERNQEMKRMRYEEYLSLQKIAFVFGISRERVRQIVGSSGEKHVILNGQKKIALENLDLTNRELAEKMGVSESSASAYRKGVRHNVEKNCKVGTGFEYEELVAKKLTQNNIPNALMPNKWPYDILLENGKKIEVKFRRNPHPDVKGYLRYNVEKIERKIMPDFYAVVINDDIYFIPFAFCGKCISIPADPLTDRGRKWEELKNNYELLR